MYVVQEMKEPVTFEHPFYNLHPSIYISRIGWFNYLDVKRSILAINAMSETLHELALIIVAQAKEADLQALQTEHQRQLDLLNTKYQQIEDNIQIGNIKMKTDIRLILIRKEEQNALKQTLHSPLRIFYENFMIQIVH